MLLLNLIQVTESISGSVVPLAMFFLKFFSKNWVFLEDGFPHVISLWQMTYCSECLEESVTCVWRTAGMVTWWSTTVYSIVLYWSPDGQTVIVATTIYCIVLVKWWSNHGSSYYGEVYCMVLVKWWSNYGSSDYSEVYCIVLVKWWSNYGLGKHGRWWNVHQHEYLW